MMISRALVCGAVVFGMATAARAESKQKAPAEKVAITTSSEEARQLYIKGRDLFEKLRATDAYALFNQAVAKDADFALAHLGMAQTAASTKEFFDSLNKALATMNKATPGEQ